MTSLIFVGDAAFCVTIGFLAGALAAGLGWRFVDAIAIALVCGGAFCILVRSIAVRTRTIFSVIFFGAFIAGTFYYFLFIYLAARATYLPYGKSISLSAIIVDEPEISNKYLLATADAQKPYAGAITLFAPPGSDLHYGDEVKVPGEIEPPQTPGDSPAMFPRTITVVARNKGFWLREDLIEFKDAISEKFAVVLSSDEAALLAGETFGGKNGMSVELQNEMSASGTSYVLSMYGYKISMVVFSLEAVLAEALARRPRFVLLAVVVILFVIMSGGNVSAVRAGVAVLLGLLAKMTGRVSTPRNLLAMTAVGMALFNPTLVVRASFALSFLSIAGIFYLVDPLKNLFRWSENGAGFLGWREAIVVAIASLVPIIPVIAAAFGDFSLSAFPSNALISVAILPAMLLGAALAGASFISYYLALFIARLGGALFFYQFAVIKVFAAIDIPLPISFNSVFAFAVYYGALGYFAYAFSGRNKINFQA